MTLDLVFLGLAITSSWGNGHATTYRGLLRELAARGHRVLFLERDVPWYAENRDLPQPPGIRTELYGSLDELRDRFARAIAHADAVVLGSYVPEGAAVADLVLDLGRGVRAFYDIDAPVTARKLARGEREYLGAEQVPRFDLYLSFTGGPLLDHLRRRFGARDARPLYCSCDPALHAPRPVEPARWDLGYLGTFSADRQPALDRLLVEPARRLPDARFAVAGPLYPDGIAWPTNVERIVHVAPPAHAAFYCAQRFTLNVTRADMTEAGYSPSVRLFEAAACGAPIISDPWPGLDAFFTPGREILIARDTDEVLALLRDLPEPERRAVGERARVRALAEHTAARRAATLERDVLEVREGLAAARRSAAHR